MLDSDRVTLERIVFDYVERYGLSDRARAYFKNLGRELGARNIVAAARSDTTVSQVSLELKSNETKS